MQLSNCINGIFDLFVLYVFVFKSARELDRSFDTLVITGLECWMSCVVRKKKYTWAGTNSTEHPTLWSFLVKYQSKHHVNSDKCHFSSEILINQVDDISTRVSENDFWLFFLHDKYNAYPKIIWP